LVLEEVGDADVRHLALDSHPQVLVGKFHFLRHCSNLARRARVLRSESAGVKLEAPRRRDVWLAPRSGPERGAGRPRERPAPTTAWPPPPTPRAGAATSPPHRRRRARLARPGNRASVFVSASAGSGQEHPLVAPQFVQR